LSIIRFPEGKKVLTRDGLCIGEIERVYVSEFGTHTAVIKTRYSEFPRFEVLITQLKPEIRQVGGSQEEVYILKNIPIKLQMVMERKKAEGKRVVTTSGKYVGYVERVYTTAAGENVAIIRTRFSDFPQFEFPVEKMKPEVEEKEGVREEVYILTEVPPAISKLLEEEIEMREEGKVTKETKGGSKKETILKIATEESKT